jgi:hypothetical protein
MLGGGSSGDRVSTDMLRRHRVVAYSSIDSLDIIEDLLGGTR